ncbi:MAG: glycosyltransferase family 2 protein [Anaerolineaceae bacterium]|nr:MAG: glycosyltransferase family 2 protein [Anaerolineaceae bacterium]
MPLITLFSAPKPFTDPHIAMIQRNAVKSWTLLPDVEVILLGEEAGLAEAACEFGVKHIPNVARNETNTPLISSMFQLARENSHSDLLCIVNADMILMPDFVEAAKQAMKLKDEFVLLSQRWDLDISRPIEFTESWQNKLRNTIYTSGALHRPAGSDFFLFPKSCYTDTPNFAIGRAGWDNWMIYKARREGWAVIDCTPTVMIVHQNHDYSHLPESKPHYEHPETNENIRIAGGEAVVRYTILDSTHQLTNGKLARPKMTSLRFMRGVELFLRAVFFFLPGNMIENIARPKRWKKRIKKIFGNR